jgi:hypothetical protein
MKIKVHFMMSRLTSLISSDPLCTSFLTVSGHEYKLMKDIYLFIKAEHVLEVRTSCHKNSLVCSQRAVFADDGEVDGRIVHS